MAAHTHDDVNWAARLPAMRRADVLFGSGLSDVAQRLSRGLPAQPTVVDIGSGSGGMSTALAAALAARDGGTLVLLDAVEELLSAAAETAAASGGASVRVHTVLADAARPDLPALLPEADLVWASSVVHHLPDQQAAVDTLAEVLHPRGLLALAEGGLDTRCLPWDLGIGRPGLETRLLSARDVWFGELRAAMENAVRMPYGWGTALGCAGLADVTSFSYLVDHPAPASELVTDFALERLEWLGEAVRDIISEADRDTVRALVDPNDPAYLGARSDVYLLSAATVHCGWRA